LSPLSVVLLVLAVLGVSTLAVLGLALLLAEALGRRGW